MVFFRILLAGLLVTLIAACAQNLPKINRETNCIDAAFHATQVAEKINERASIQYSLHAIEVCTRELGSSHKSTLDIVKFLIFTYSFLEEHEKGSQLNEDALKISREKLGNNFPDTLILIDTLASTYSKLGQYGKSLSLNQEAYLTRRKNLGEDHLETMLSMHYLAGDYRNLGQFDKALALDESLLKLQRLKLGNDHPDTWISINNLAQNYSELGQFEKALVLQKQTLQWRQTKLGSDDPFTLSAMNNLAGTYTALGMYNDGLSLFEQVLKLRREKFGENHDQTLISMGNLAGIYTDLHQNEKARQLFERALSLTSAKFGAEHPRTLIAISNLANTYSYLSQLENALALVPKIVSGIEKARNLPGTSVDQQQSIFSKYSDQYQMYSRWYATSHQTAEGFRLGDLSKARTLTDSIKAQTAMRSLPESEQKKVLANQANSQDLRARLDKLNNLQNASPTDRLILQKELNESNDKYAKLLADLSSRYPKYAQLTNLKAATAADASRLLGNDEIYISYLLRAEGGAQAWLLDRNGVAKWVDLKVINNHQKTVAAYRELVAPSNAMTSQGRLVAFKNGGYQWLQLDQVLPKDAKIITDSPAGALKILNQYWHETLIKPVLPIASSYKRWIVSPDKDLALLPFDALPSSLELEGRATAVVQQTVAQLHNMTLVQSFAVYALLKQREAEYAKFDRPKDLFAMGNAVYGEGWTANQGIKRANGSRSFEVKDRNASMLSSNILVLKPVAEQNLIDQLNWNNLPGTAREVQAVSQALTDFKSNAGKENSRKVASLSNLTGKVDAYLGQQASEANLMELNKTGKLKDYRYLLFSAHGYLAQNPVMSALVLSQIGNPPGIDGYITANEWPLYDLNSDLTVLSACDTGVGKTQAGESVMGLPYALFVAGNKNTLLTLWPVDDEATAEFMSRFFTKLKAGNKQHVALSLTKQEFMQHPIWRNPKYWAAFVLYGA
jgi:hypothetical protein